MNKQNRKVEARYPAELLNQSLERRVEYFSSCIVEHAKFDANLQLADDKLDRNLKQRVILLVGPSGVGKTALLQSLVNRRLHARREEMRTNPLLLPALWLEAQAPDVGAFDMSTLHSALLFKMGAPLLQSTLAFKERAAGAAILKSIDVEMAARKNKAGNRERARLHMAVRELDLCGIDEAGQIFVLGAARSKLKTAEDLAKQAAKLRSLVNLTPTSLALCGAYDFFELSLASGQLARRSRIVHFESYKDTDKDIRDFVKALIGLLARLPALNSIDPVRDAAEICLNSAGRVGLASDYFKDALLAHCKTGKAFDIELLRAQFLPLAALKRLREEEAEGARRVNQLLSTRDPGDPDDALPGRADGDDDAAQAAPPKAPPKRPLKPGESKPSHRRDATGTWA